MPRKPRSGQCVYCGDYGLVTRDHVPPKCLFPRNVRVNLVTVKACGTCHEGFKLDDEYFRVALSIRADLPEGQEAAFLREQTRRMLRDPAARSFQAAIRAATTRVPVNSDTGVYLGETTAINLNPVRITKTAQRIVRGLYAKYFGRPLPDTHEVTVSILDFQHNNTALESPETKEMLALIGEYGIRQSFGATLDLRYLKIDDDAESSVWWVCLHGGFGFLGFTLPREVYSLGKTDNEPPLN